MKISTIEYRIEKCLFEGSLFSTNKSVCGVPKDISVAKPMKHIRFCLYCSVFAIGSDFIVRQYAYPSIQCNISSTIFLHVVSK